jgi:hypothetical protein
MNGVQLAEVEEEKDVGDIIHKSLKPSRQCERAANTAMGILAQIAKCFHYRDKNIFVKLYRYTQHVRPHLEFATPAWSPWLTADKQRLEKVQERAVRMISGMGQGNYEEKCKQIGLETLERRRTIQDMAQTFKLVSGVDKVRRVNLFNHIQEGRTRLAADQLNMRSEVARTEVRKNFYTQRIVNEWNRIPSECKRSKTVKEFKMAYRRYLSTTDGEP